MLPIRAETTVSIYGSFEISRLEKESKNRIGSFDKFQFGASAMVASEFEGLRG